MSIFKNTYFCLLTAILAMLLSLPGCTMPSYETALAPPLQADYIVVEKAAHIMTLYDRGLPVKTYSIALGQGGLAPKRQQGDQRTPEGLYFIAGRNPHSHFHNALLISYPNAQDKAWAASHGVPPGGEIMIHGSKNGNDPFEWLRRLHGDWTNGCIAVSDADIDEIAAAVPDGTPVAIEP